MAWSEADTGVEGGRQAPEQRNGRFGAAFFDAIDLVGGHADADGELSDAEAKGDPPVLDRLPEGQGLADRDRQEHDRRGIRLIERQVPQASA